jgi:sugar lactone lactonase YvrE
VVGFAPLATLVTVGADGGVQTFATLTDAAASNTFTLGIVSPGPNANVYVGVGTMIAADAGPEAGSIVPAPGVYRGSAAGGFALWSAAPSMRFPNGFDLVGNTLFVADSGGTIFRIDLTTSTATAWSTDPLLAPNVAACAGVVGLPIGANGIVHDANNFYVTNTDYGRIVKLPMAADGGSASVLVEDCTALAGADGVVLDTRDNSLLVAVNVQDKIVRVATTDGGTSVVTSGSPLDSPASVFIDSTDAGRRLLFTNAAFFSMPDAALPGLLELPIP